MRKSSFYSLGCITFLSILTGCDDQQDVKVYRVSKEIPQPALSSTNPLDGISVPTKKQLLITTPPAGWSSQPLTSMRLASFLVKGEQGATADISLVMLGGPSGGRVENVNRWLSQLGQPDLDDAKLLQIAKNIPSKLGDILFVDLEGLPSGSDPAKDGRILGGILSVEGGTVFFKMRGNAALAEAQKENFTQWITSIQFEDEVPTQETGSSAMSNLPPMQSIPTVDLEETAKQRLKWVVPENWKSAPKTSMRYASFAISGPDGTTGDLSVSFYPGEAGGDLNNVNRWRDQIGLKPVPEIASLVSPLTGKGLTFSTLDMTGPKGHLLVGWIKQNGNTWFFKLLASDAIIASEKVKFAKFLQSIEFLP